jgi:hypothetical protein
MGHAFLAMALGAIGIDHGRDVAAVGRLFEQCFVVSGLKIRRIRKQQEA